MRTMLANHVSNLGVPRKDMFELVIPGYDLTLAVESTAIPKMVTDANEHNYGNSVVKTAGKTKPDGNMSVKFKQFLDADVVGTLIAWRRKVYNPATGATGHPKDYKIAECYINQYDPSGEKRIAQWVIEGVFPLSVDTGDMDYTSGDPCMVDAEFSYDKVYRKDHLTVQPSNIKG